MTRRTRTALLASLAATSLLLAGCGGSDDGGDEGLPGADTEAPADGGDGGDGGDGADDEEDADGAGGEGVERPDVTLPDEVRNVFADWESDDAREQAVLTDARAQVNAMDLAVVERDPDADYVEFYTAQEALINGREWIQGFLDNNLTITGTVRYEEPSLEFQDDESVVIEFCADESDAQSVDVDSGAELESDTDPEIRYTKVLQEDDRGVWVATSVITQRGECSV